MFENDAFRGNVCIVVMNENITTEVCDLHCSCAEFCVSNVISRLIKCLLQINFTFWPWNFEKKMPNIHVKNWRISVSKLVPIWGSQRFAWFYQVMSFLFFFNYKQNQKTRCVIGVVHKTLTSDTKPDVRPHTSFNCIYN